MAEQTEKTYTMTFHSLGANGQVVAGPGKIGGAVVGIPSSVEPADVIKKLDGAVLLPLREQHTVPWSKIEHATQGSIIRL